MQTGPSQAEGRLGGARARDIAEVQDGTVADADHAVLTPADVASGKADGGIGSGARARSLVATPT